ncbi:MAG: YdcF family protein [Synechococcaceae cyanobacterium]|nr:YdcF family protein [Synechococcaceae cyanobacterium]
MLFLLSKLLPLLLLPLGLSLLLLLWGALRGSRWPGIASLSLLWLFSTPLTAELLWRWLESPYQRQSAASVLSGLQGSASPGNDGPPAASAPNSGPAWATASAGPGFRPGSAGSIGDGSARPRAPVAPPAALAVVVLGTGRHPAPGPARASEWIDADRFFGGIEAYQQLRRQGLRPRLIFTGGWWPNQPQFPPEGDVLRQRALALGLPPADLFTTVKVRNTAEEAAAVASQLPRGSRVVLVTSAFHLPRAQRLFERQGLRVIPFAVDFQASGLWAGHPLADPLNYIPSAQGLDRSSRALREALGRTLYRAW